MLVAEEKIVESTAAGVDKVAEHVEDSITFIDHLQTLAVEYFVGYRCICDRSLFGDVHKKNSLTGYEPSKL